MRKQKSMEERLSQYIQCGGEDECWNWTGRTNKVGRPIASIEYTTESGRHVDTVSIQRVVLEKHLGREIQSRYVDPTCGNSLCCNPNHLQERDFENRFWNNVVETNKGCWEWQGSISSNGYGVITVDGVARPTHVLSYELTNGEIPNGLFVLHKCNVRLCINPDHLYIGTHNDNMDDMSNSNVLKGERNANSVLSENDVREIRKLISSRMVTYANIAQQYGVKRQTIKDIALGRTWSWLK